MTAPAPLRDRIRNATALSPLAGASGVVAALLLAALPAYAQDASQPAPNPVVPVPGGGTNLDFGGNGVPVVKIATPDANGTSYNRYQSFNVDARGVVLNNSDKIVQSRLAGYIDGNKALKTSGPASLIINEVVAANPSRLNGYIEVAGPAADVVLANPYGIACDGCGFVNTARVTLAAGAPLLDAAGALSGFRITNGAIAVGGRGLDATNARLELFARAVAINAGLYADAVSASFGAGDVNRDGEVVVTARRNPAQADQPAFGLDVAALGGMYARSIRLIGTERGLGVNVAGDLAGLEQGVSLSVDGRVSVAGSITARTAIGIETAGALDVAGQVYGEGATTLASGSLTGGGLIGSGGDLTVTTGTATLGGTLAAGLARDGRVSQAGTLSVDVGGAAALSGRVLAHDALTLRTGAVANRGLISGNALTLRTGQLDNAGGTIDARAGLDAQAGAVVNTGGVIQAGGTLALTGTSLANARGAVLALGDGALRLGLTGAIGGADGQIGGNGDVTIAASALGVAGAAGAVTAARQLDLAVGGALSVSDKALVASGGAANVTVGGATTVVDAGLQAGGALALKAGSVTLGGGGRLSGSGITLASTGALTNAGLIASAGRVGIAVGAATNTGTIVGDGGLSATVGGTFVQNGSVASDAGIAIDAGTLTSQGGTIEAGGALGIAAGSIALDRATLLATGTGALSLASRGALTATMSRLGGNGGVSLTGTTLGLTGTRVTALDALTLAATTGDLALNGAGMGATTLENGGDLTLRAGGTLSHVADIVGRGRNLTLAAGRIENAGGAILHLGDGALTLTGTLANTGGRIATNGALSVNAGAVANDGGTITAAGPATLAIGGDLNNDRGLVATGGALTLNAGAVGNSGGSIEGVGALVARLGALTGGTVVATGPAGRLDLDVTGAVGGTNLLLGAVGDATIRGGSFTLDRTARLTAGGALAVSAQVGDLNVGGGKLDAARIALATARALLVGDGGLVQSTGATTIEANSLVTTGGRVAAGGRLSVAADLVGNRAGTLVSGRDGATIRTGTLLNDRGTLGGDGAVTITTGLLDNGTGVLAAGTDLTLTAASLANAATGQVYADRDARLSVAGMLVNRGSIAAARDLTVAAGTLDGSGGVLAGGRLVDVAGDGGSLGRLVAPTALTLRFAGDLTNAAGDTIATPGALNLAVRGTFTNFGAVQGGTAVAIATGGAIANQAGGSIVAPEVTLTAGTTLTNAGLINGTGVTLRGGQVDNTGAIFGDRIAVFGTTGISNAGENAVIATRSGALMLASGGDIVNRDGALLYSLGNIAITGADGTGRAGSLQNLSADIQAQGSIAIAATRVVNDRALFTTEEALLSSRDVENEDRRDREHRTITEYRETVTDTQVTGDSGAARIIGGTIRVDADSVLNRLSTISAAGDLNVGAAAVTNTAFTGYNTTTQLGTIKDQKRDCFLFFCGGWDTRSTMPFNSVDAQPTFTIPSTITAGGTLTIDAVSIANLTLTPGGGTADLFAASATPGAFGSGAAVGATVTGPVRATGSAPGAVAGTGIDPTFGFAIRAPSDRAGGGVGGATLDLGGLFRYADATSQFLVEADSRFSNYNDFLSSDYFLDRLGYDPARVQRRLGDGLYEQQLIANQLVALIGAQRIAGYADNQAQYRALLDAGATYAKSFSLGLGVALSAAQMATLTSDIVLLVETVVQTPSGPQTVLAPRVYLTKAAVGDLTSGGAIIAGRDLQLRASDSLANAGVIRATASSTIVGGDITNSGRLDLGSRGIVSASRDLLDRGGAITGGDLTLAAGRDLTLVPVETTRTVATRYYAGRSDQQVSLTTTTTNRGTDLAATGNVDLVAGRTLSVTGASVAAGGDLSVYGGQNVAIGSATDSGTAFSIGREGKTLFTQTQSEQRNVLSELKAGGDVTLATPGQLAVTGASVVAGGALVADAGSIAVTGVVDSTRLQRDTSKTTGGFLSSTKTTTKYDGTDQSVVASTLSGDTVALRSTGDTRIAGSNVVADNGVAIVTGGALDIGTVTATDSEAQSTRVKKSGLSIGGGGLFLGVAKTQNDVNTVSVTNTGSLIGSTAGDVTLDAGRALNVTGSQVAGTGLTRLTGESVTIRNATDTVQTDTLSKSSSIGISVGIQSPVLSGLQGVRDSARILGNDNANARTTAVAGLAGGLAAYNAGDALSGDPRNLASVGVSLGVSSSKATSNTRDETVVGSRIAGQDVAIAARGAGAVSTITVQGSEVAATRDVTLSAPGAITLRSATETDTLAQANRSSGVSVGVQFGAGGFTPSASLNLGKGNASGTDVRNVETTVSAGNTLSIATPGALTLQGAQASGRRVEVDAGSLAIVSEQDRASYAERQRNIGLSVSAANGGTVAGNLTNSRQTGEFASVREQSGLFAGSGGYDINVAGNTNLVGGVIASEADAARNRLSTGSLSASDLANTERYSASSLSIGGGIGAVGKDSQGQATGGTTRDPGSDLPGVRTALGTVSATPPIALGASGRQAGTTYAAIAPGAIDITSGDAASRGIAATISRDPASANAGALEQRYDANKREEIGLGFAAATQLANQTGTFFANRANEEKAARARADAAQQQLARGVDADGNPLSGAAIEQLSRIVVTEADRAKDLRDSFGAGSAARIIATAINGAAGSNVTGSFGSLVQGAAANAIQSLAVREVKTIADSLQDARGNATAQSEAVRTAFQAVVGCAGASAGGGSCGSAATGAAASVVLNYLLTGFVDKKPPIDPVTGRPSDRSLEDQEARKNIVATIVAGIADGSGLNASYAVVAAQTETENNDLAGARTCGVASPTCQGPTIDQYLARPAVRNLVAALGLSDAQARACLQPGPECASVANYRANLLTELSRDGTVNPDDAARVGAADLNQLSVITAQSEADRQYMTALRASSPALADKLAGQSLAVRTLVYEDIRNNAGDNVVGRLAAGVLGAVFDDNTLADLYLANKSDAAGERHGAFDEALARFGANATKIANNARAAADAEAVRRRAAGVPEALVQAYLFKEYYNAAADERTSTALLGQVQFLGDYVSDPARVAGNVVSGTVQRIDNVLLDDTSAAEYVRRFGGSVDAFVQSSLTDKATTLGTAQGSATAAAVDALVSRGGSALADAAFARRVATVPGTVPTVPRTPGLSDAALPEADFGTGIYLSSDKIAEIMNLPKLQRPDPTTYLSAAQIEAHLAPFRGGVTKIKYGAPVGVEGPPGGTFVMSTLEADSAIARAGGDISALERILGLPPGDLGTAPVRVDIPKPVNLRVPSGNERGANSSFIPGGITSGGVREATIDPVPVGSYTVTPLVIKKKP